MNKIQLALIFVILLTISCRKDCREKSFWTNIALANNTQFEIDILLFPKDEYMIHDGMYRINAVGGGGGHTTFTIEPGSISMWSFKYVIYTTNDTLIKPSELLTLIFDSLHIEVEDSVNTKIKFNPDDAINYLKNPFTNDSIWTYKRINSDTPDSFCPNPGETKSNRLYIEQEMIMNE
jgi:hypothetical protein